MLLRLCSFNIENCPGDQRSKVWLVYVNSLVTASGLQLWSGWPETLHNVGWNFFLGQIQPIAERNLNVIAFQLTRHPHMPDQSLPDIT